MKINRNGFSLVEIIVVMTIIIIMSSLLIPTISGARKSALKTRSKLQFKEYESALISYYEEYFCFPEFLVGKEDRVVNLATCNQAFITALSKKSPLNPNGIPFHHFTEQEFSNNLLSDAFKNPNIYIIVDSDGDGYLTHPELSEFGRIYGQVALFTKSSGGETSETIYSWQ